MPKIKIFSKNKNTEIMSGYFYPMISESENEFGKTKYGKQDEKFQLSDKTRLSLSLQQSGVWFVKL